jgi:hypothetical protein
MVILNPYMETNILKNYKMKRHRFNTKLIYVDYWTAKDDREGSSCPCGHAKLWVSENYDSDRVFNLKRFKRRNGESRIYDISVR